MSLGRSGQLAERDALSEGQGTSFCVTNAQLRASEQSARLVGNIARIQRQAERPGPYLYGVYDGYIKWCGPRTGSQSAGYQSRIRPREEVPSDDALSCAIGPGARASPESRRPPLANVPQAQGHGVKGTEIEVATEVAPARLDLDPGSRIGDDRGFVVLGPTSQIVSRKPLNASVGRALQSDLNPLVCQSHIRPASLLLCHSSIAPTPGRPRHPAASRTAAVSVS